MCVVLNYHNLNKKKIGAHENIYMIILTYLLILQIGANALDFDIFRHEAGGKIIKFKVQSSDELINHCTEVECWFYYENDFEQRLDA